MDSHEALHASKFNIKTRSQFKPESMLNSTLCTKLFRKLIGLELAPSREGLGDGPLRRGQKGQKVRK